MNALEIIKLTSLLLELSAKYLVIAQQNTELTPEQEAEFQAQLQLSLTKPWMKIDQDPID